MPRPRECTICERVTEDYPYYNRTMCRKCYNEYQADYYHSNKERINERRRRRYRRHSGYHEKKLLAEHGLKICYTCKQVWPIKRFWSSKCPQCRTDKKLDRSQIDERLNAIGLAKFCGRDATAE